MIGVADGVERTVRTRNRDAEFLRIDCGQLRNIVGELAGGVATMALEGLRQQILILD